jgi:putative sugar O-methyltransferase
MTVQTLTMRFAQRLVDSTAEGLFFGADKPLRGLAIEQRRRFAGLVPTCWRLVDELPLDETLVTDAWRRFNAEIRAAFPQGPAWNFLRTPVIRHTMVYSKLGGATAYHVGFIEAARLGLPVERLLREDAVGRPIIVDRMCATSATHALAAYHLARFERSRGVMVSRMRRFVEWGGGYGKLASIVRRLAPDATYLIIDTPVMIGMQCCYLRSIFGEEEVIVHGVDDRKIVDGKINLMPAHDLKTLDFKADIFISTFALNESSAASQQLMYDLNFADADRLLLAFTKLNPVRFSATDALRLAQERGGSIEKIPYADGTLYAFV